MENILTDEQLISLLDVLEEGEKSFTQASYRDLIMTAHTDLFFELGVRDVATMDAGWTSFKGLQTKFSGKLMSVYSKFQAGTMSTAGATTEFQTLLRKFSKDAFMSGTQIVGNKYYSEVGMTKKDLAFINKYVRAETRHFRKFLNDIKDPKHLPANKIPRDKLGRMKPGYRQQVHPYTKRIGYYGDSLRSMGYNGMVAGAGTLLNIYWVMDKLSGRRSPHCEDCVMISAGNPYSWQTLPTTPRAGDTQCLFRCYCGLELQQRKGRGKEFDIPGTGSTQGLTAPGRWAKIFDRFGRPISGAPLQDIEDIYQQMYKARQMIEITRAQEKLSWIRTRQQLNNTLINQYPQYRKIPSVSIKDLTKAVLKAQPENAIVLKNLIGIEGGVEVTFLRGNYFANGKLFLERGQWIFKDATGVKLIANLETDVIWKLKPKTTLFDTSKISTSKKLGGGICDTRKVTLADGEIGVYKPESGESGMLVSATGGALYKREAAAYEVAKIMGWDDLVPETVIKRGPDHIGSVQKWVNGKTASAVENAVMERIAKFERERLFAFDALIANGDRHGGNLMITSTSKIKAIDNGCAFPTDKYDSLINFRPYYSEYYDSTISLQVKDAMKKLLANKAVLKVKLHALGLEKKAIDLLFQRAKSLSRLRKYYESSIFSQER